MLFIDHQKTVLPPWLNLLGLIKTNIIWILLIKLLTDMLLLATTMIQRLMQELFKILLGLIQINLLIPKTPQLWQDLLLLWFKLNKAKFVIVTTKFFRVLVNSLEQIQVMSSNRYNLATNLILMQLGLVEQVEHLHQMVQHLQEKDIFLLLLQKQILMVKL